MSPRRASRLPETPERRRAFGTRLRAWYRRTHRDLPWRRTRDPYHVLISELMLQQTQVSRVVDYYEAFLERFPSLAALARAPQRAVLESWDGLGYYARARNLHALARAVAPNGEPNTAIPADPLALRALPGIGAYTAGAVASFAYERRAALVDTNVARVLGRVFLPGVDVKKGAGHRAVWALAERLLPRTGKAAWVHNQAVMELGALVCTARVLRCGECPVREVCATYAAARSSGVDGPVPSRRRLATVPTRTSPQPRATPRARSTG
ncbi:MAG: A/G-specific adenine glycosylase [Gemmatimonadaceae bacterium]|nr:A/G-specific adenine glycosylase [Gemmatimonadaceae bacterium]